ncbi:MAG: helix-turn-helix domain-containing protein [Anaerovoracaceae bacterium]
MARKNKYEYWLTEDGLTLLRGWARDGLTDEQISENIGISRSTLSEWKKKHPDIKDSLKSGKEVADYEVERSLYKKCVGHYAKVGKAFKCKEVYYDEEGNRCEKEVVKVADVDVFIPPDTMAIAIWLNNRRPDKWRRNAGKEKLDEKKFEHEKDIDKKRYW